MSGVIEEFLLNSGWAGLVILGLLWAYRDKTTEARDLRAQIDAMHTENLRQRDETIRELINRGGLTSGGRHE